MPKGFEIDKDQLQKNILEHIIQDCTFPFSKEWDKLNTYLREHINLEYGFTLINKLTTGLIFKPNQSKKLLLHYSSYYDYYYYNSYYYYYY